VKSTKLLLRLLLLVTIVAGIFGYYSHAQAQRKADVVEYLNQRFQSRNLPVISIEILELSPLKLQIVVESMGDDITPQDLKNLRKVDREVFIVAHKNGYIVERYTRILQDSQGNQLYKLEQGPAEVNQPTRPPTVSDNDVRKLLRKRVESLLNEHGIPNVKVTIDVYTIDGSQSLDMQIAVSSIDEAYSAFGFLHDNLIYPLDPVIAAVNDQGGQIIVTSYEIIDNEDQILFFYVFDYQLQRGTWSNSTNFPVDLSEGGALPPTDLPSESLTLTPEATELPVETTSPTP
jgi:hypothetical protein